MPKGSVPEYKMFTQTHEYDAYRNPECSIFGYLGPLV